MVEALVVNIFLNNKKALHPHRWSVHSALLAHFVPLTPLQHLKGHIQHFPLHSRENIHINILSVFINIQHLLAKGCHRHILHIKKIIFFFWFLKNKKKNNCVKTLFQLFIYPIMDISIYLTKFLLKYFFRL